MLWVVGMIAGSSSQRLKHSQTEKSRLEALESVSNVLGVINYEVVVDYHACVVYPHINRYNLFLQSVSKIHLTFRSKGIMADSILVGQGTVAVNQSALRPCFGIVI